MTKSRARWATEAEDLSYDLDRAARQLTIIQLAHETGLSVNTIEDSLTRKKITSPDNPRGAIDRPAYMVGGDPLWSPEQLQEFLRRAAINTKVELPLISSEEADDRGLISTNELAAWLGIHDQTVRKWEANFNDTYPPAVGRRSRNGLPGVPEHVRETSAIVDWIKARNAENAAAGVAPLVALPEEAEL